MENGKIFESKMLPVSKAVDFHQPSPEVGLFRLRPTLSREAIVDPNRGTSTKTGIQELKAGFPLARCARPFTEGVRE
jgi:hypothetical protein